MNFLDDRLPARFWDKVVPEPNSGCWLWVATLDLSGYASFSVREHGRDSTRRGHRVSYEALVGPIGAGLVIDHRVCGVKSCVNPAHLEPVTAAENTRRWNERRSHCHRGHAFTPANTYRFRGWRHCRECRNAINRTLRRRP